MKIFTQKQIAILALIYSFSISFSRAQFNNSLASKISFKENLGQVSDQNYHARQDVLFSGTTGNLVFHLKNSGVSYQLNKVESWRDQEDFMTKEIRKVIDKNSIYRIDINWLNINEGVIIEKGLKLKGYENYYLSSCPNGALNVNSYNAITYKQVYDGIDLIWYEKEGTLKYDYQVNAGADYAQIQFEIKGASQLSINKEGELLIETPLGTVTEQAPLVKQNGKTLASRWKLNENIVSFEIDHVDSTKPFVIDPAIRVWGTYFGDNSLARSCATTANGDVFIFGETGSGLLNIATSGAHQITWAGHSEAYFAKFNSSGSRLWSTYYGGKNDESGISGTLDTLGNIYMAGTTNSDTAGVIATVGSHQYNSGNPNGLGYDGFLVKFNALGVRQWGTYYGGSRNEIMANCKADKFGNVYICGYTRSDSATYIATNGSHQSSFGGDGQYDNDGFLVKFNSSGTRLWGTYYGGDGDDYINSCDVDNLGNIFISGFTHTGTGTIIATPGSYQPTKANGNSDLFLVKFNTSGVRQWGTYYGKMGNGTFGGACVDLNGDVFITGTANSYSDVATPGSFQTTNLTGHDAFLTKFSGNGSLLWGTYYAISNISLGGSDFCISNAQGDVYFGGRTENPGINNTISTAGSHQENYGGGNLDAFLVKFSGSGSRIWGTLYGGLNYDWGYNCAPDKFGNIYMCGRTNSGGNTAIANPGSFQDTLFNQFSFSAFLVKFNDTGFAPVNVTELKLKGQTKLNIYPNPSSEQINLIFSDEKIANNYSSFELINNLGSVCLKGTVKFENFSFAIRTGDLVEGCYILNLYGKSFPVLSRKVIISK